MFFRSMMKTGRSVVWTWLYLDQAFIDRLLNLPVGMANAHNEPLVTPGWGFLEFWII